MKLISLAFICLFAMAPFLLMADIRSDFLSKSLDMRSYYDAAIDNAISDAAWVMAGSVREGAGYGSGEGMQTDEQAAVMAFFDSLYAGLGATGIPAAEARVRAHVPVLVTVGPHGASLLVQTPYLDGNRVLVTNRVRLPARPYSWDPGDGRHFVRFTMGTDIQVYDRLEDTLRTEPWMNFPSLFPGLQSEDDFASRRLAAITRVVRSLLDEGIALAMAGTARVRDTADDVLPVSGPNAGVPAVAAEAGYGFRFDLPGTGDAAFRRAVSDVGVLAFVQGLPVGGDRTYDTFAFGGGRIIRKTQVVGYSWDSRFFYCRPDCPLYLERLTSPVYESSAARFFPTAQEAAAEGFEPCPACRP